MSVMIKHHSATTKMMPKTHCGPTSCLQFFTSGIADANVPAYKPRIRRLDSSIFRDNYLGIFCFFMVFCSGKFELVLVMTVVKYSFLTSI